MTILQQYFMFQALRHAKRGSGRTGENPSVGCVIVRKNASGGEQVISVGRTADGGRPHAEVVALNGVSEITDDMVLYVTLEPCAHHGKTPPCADAIINAGIKHVVIACLDDDARVNGAGVAKLQQAGVLVEIGVLESEAKQHHFGFLNRIKHGLPEIMVKIATTADEKITAPERWITGELARNYGQMLRSRYDAIVTGIGTVACDNPSLNVRLAGLQQYSPKRVVLDRRLRIDLSAKIVQDYGGALVITSNNDMDKIKSLQARNVEVAVLNADFSFKDAMAHLGGRGINSVMVEGGQAITTAALDSGLANDLYWFIAQNKIAGEEALAAIKGGSLCDYVKHATLQQKLYFGDDELLHYAFQSSKSAI